MLYEGGKGAYQDPLPLLVPLPELDVLVAVAAVPVVVCTAPWLAQKLVYQPWRLPRAAGVAEHALSHGPAVVEENAARRESWQKQES